MYKHVCICLYAIEITCTSLHTDHLVFNLTEMSTRRSRTCMFKVCRGHLFGCGGLQLQQHCNNTATHCNALQLTALHCNTLYQSVPLAPIRKLRSHTATAQLLRTHMQNTQHTASKFDACTYSDVEVIYCITLQHTATYCNILQHAAARCSTLQHTATYCIIAWCGHLLDVEVTHSATLLQQDTATPLNTLQYTASKTQFHNCTTAAAQLNHNAPPHCTILSHIRKRGCRLAHCNTLQHTATHRNTPQHTALHCNTLNHTTTHGTTLHHTVPHCAILRHTAPHCTTLHYAATQGWLPFKACELCPIGKMAGDIGASTCETCPAGMCVCVCVYLYVCACVCVCECVCVLCVIQRSNLHS